MRIESGTIKSISDMNPPATATATTGDGCGGDSSAPAENNVFGEQPRLRGRSAEDEADFQGNGFGDEIHTFTGETREGGGGEVTAAAASNIDYCLATPTAQYHQHQQPPPHFQQVHPPQPHHHHLQQQQGIQGPLPVHHHGHQHPQHPAPPPIGVPKAAVGINGLRASRLPLTPPASQAFLSGIDRFKLEKKRERNRIAASKCRQRKLEKISELEGQVQQLKGENDALKRLSDRLRADVRQLKGQLDGHLRRGCRVEGIPLDGSTAMTAIATDVPLLEEQARQTIDNPDSTCLS